MASVNSSVVDHTYGSIQSVGCWFLGAGIQVCMDVAVGSRLAGGK